jgi:predicted MFS family arabinose efflux permease
VLLAFTALKLASLLIIVEAPDYGILIVARAVLGAPIGGF